MSHFAKIENGTVTEVIVAEQDFIDTISATDKWVQTSYNTVENKYVGTDQNKQPLRGNYAGIGFIYDEINDVFYPPKPHPNATLDTATWTWTGFPTTVL